MINKYLVLAGGAMLLTHCGAKEEAPETKTETKKEAAAATEKWVSIFNGKDLTGWTPKIKGYALGENFGNTFRVTDGVLQVNYDGYTDGWKNRYGHLFYKEELSHYKLRLEYRFMGEQIKSGAGWAKRNSGIMIHGQSAASMKLGQSFPASIEVQLLGGNGDGKARSTLNLCTPGTDVEYKGKLLKRHILNSSSETYHGEQWVAVEVEVHGGKVIKHIIDGKVVLEYKKPQLDNGTILEKGTISLQSESHAVEFRKIEVLKLKK